MQPTKSHLGKLLASFMFLSPALAGQAAAEITLDVLYTTPGTFNSLHEELAKQFSDANPDIRIKFRNPVKGYEEAAQQILRDQITQSLPDVAFNGINQIGLFVERGLGAALDDHIQTDGGLEALGYYPTLAALGQWKGKQYGLTFAVSTPVLYINENLVRAAGADPSHLPSNWGQLLEIGKAVETKAASPVTGFYYQWEQTGNWLFQSLVTSKGGRMLGENGCSVAFDTPAGMWALETLESFGKAGMPNLSLSQARQSFVSGKIGILADSTSYVAAAEKQINGAFPLKTIAFPLADTNGKLPAGGNVAMVFVTDKERQDAAWRYVKFVTGPEGQALMANYTGYMPGNRLAVERSDLLSAFYDEHPNHKTSLDQLPVLTEWASFPGENALKIIESIKNQTEALVSGRATAAQTMPILVKDVSALLPATCK